MTLPINPETRVGALLDAYPGIDDVLIAWVPAFAKLKNPVLRKTVAKLATLEQAARVGGVDVRELVLKLREATGQATEQAESFAHGASDAEAAPVWLDEKRVEAVIDADALLETGEHPIGRMRQAGAGLAAGGIVKLTSSFRPEPLLEAMRRAGFAVCCFEQEPGRYFTYMCRT